MATFKAGDRVTISDRPATAADQKSGLFYGHYRGLSGKVQKAYLGEEVAVEVDLERLPEEIWKRHMTTCDQMRQRWLEGLAEEQRRRLSPEQNNFELRYVVLVSAKDLARQRAAGG